MSCLLHLAASLLLFFSVVFLYFKWKFTYWKRRNINYLEPKFPFGSLQNPFKTRDTFGVMIKKIYQEIRLRKWRHAGAYFFSRPIYFIADLDYAKTILTKDFQYFVNRGIYYNEKDDPLSANLLTIEDQKWRNLRIKLSPTFTSGKMKMMFPIFVECLKSLHEKLESEARIGEPIDIKEILGCFTTDVIGSCAFGLDLNNFKDEDSFFRKYGREIFMMSLPRRILMFLTMNLPQVARYLHVRMHPKHITEYFLGIVESTVEYREKNNFRRNDFLQLLIDLKKEEEGLSVVEIAAQSFIFFLGGFETSSTTMTWALYELALNQEIQERARKEVVAVLSKHENQITYEAIQEMKYLDLILNETLRKYPPFPFISRECSKDYKVPDEDAVIEKGMRTIIPVFGIHYDEEYYPDPEKFDPERFNEDNSKRRHLYAHLPFGEGPRNCIGMRFGWLQSKIGLAFLLTKFKFTLNKKTKQPLKFAVASLFLAAEGDIWLNAEAI